MKARIRVVNDKITYAAEVRILTQPGCSSANLCIDAIRSPAATHGGQ